MISTFWNNIRNQTPVQLIISSGETKTLAQIKIRDVRNRGDLTGIILETLTKNAAPGSSKNLTIYYAFSMFENRVPAELLTGAASQACELDTGGSGTRRSYSLPIDYMGGDYLHIWGVADAFTNPTCQLELDLTVLAKTLT